MILDTNAVSDLAGRNSHLLSLLGSTRELVLSFVSISEFRFGLLGSSRPEEGHIFLRELTSALPVFFPDLETTDHYAWVADHLKRKGRPIPHNDMWTAALARQHSLPIVSKDRHFDFIEGIQRVSW